MSVLSESRIDNTFDDIVGVINSSGSIGAVLEFGIRMKIWIGERMPDESHIRNAAIDQLDEEA